MPAAADQADKGPSHIDEGPSQTEELAVHDERRLYKSKTAMLQARAQEGRHDAYRTIGIITIEDVIEELLQVCG